MFVHKMCLYVHAQFLSHTNTLISCHFLVVKIVILSAAVLFLEFWKRRQFFLQYDWDMLGFEDAEVCGLLFVHSYIVSCSSY